MRWFGPCIKSWAKGPYIMLGHKRDCQNISRMHWEWLQIFIMLPGIALVIIPALILLFTLYSGYSPRSLSFTPALFWLALLAVSLGLTLILWTGSLLKKIGMGTPASWDPPQKLVVLGPYRYVRNPMTIGEGLILLAEAMFLQSWPIAVWMVFLLTANGVYFRLVEEEDLKNRFGNRYLKYKANVPRWIPRLKPWRPTGHVSQ